MACEDYRWLDETLIFGNVAESGHLLPLHQRPAGNRSENNSRAAECVKADEVGGHAFIGEDRAEQVSLTTIAIGSPSCRIASRQCLDSRTTCQLRCEPTCSR